MCRHTLAQPLTLTIGTLSRSELLCALGDEGVGLNSSAETLLNDPVFERPTRQSITVAERSVSELGLDGDGAVLSRIHQAGLDRGLRLCPPITGPYLRLALRSQPNAPDSVMSSGRAPSGSLTIASAPLRTDDDYPKGFYLRVVNEQPWLRGYHCDDSHAWNPDDRFLFEVPA